MRSTACYCKDTNGQTHDGLINSGANSRRRTAMSNQARHPRTHFLRWNILIGGLFLLQLHALDASAQVLNQQVNSLLANNCAGLGTGGFPVPNLTGLGPNLAAICNTPQTLGSVSTGGGAASVQGSAASILNRALIGRLQEIESEDEERPSSPSSTQLNPLGLMSAGTMRNLSVSSPFYASTTGSGGSSAAHAIGSVCSLQRRRKNLHSRWWRRKTVTRR